MSTLQEIDRDIDELRKRLKIERERLKRQEIEVAYVVDLINACKQERYKAELERIP